MHSCNHSLPAGPTRRSPLGPNRGAPAQQALQHQPSESAGMGGGREGAAPTLPQVGPRQVPSMLHAQLPPSFAFRTPAEHQPAAAAQPDQQQWAPASAQPLAGSGAARHLASQQQQPGAEACGGTAVSPCAAGAQLDEEGEGEGACQQAKPAGGDCGFVSRLTTADDAAATDDDVSRPRGRGHLSCCKEGLLQGSLAVPNPRAAPSESAVPL